MIGGETQVHPEAGAPCERCESPIFPSDLRCPVCALPCPAKERAVGAARTTIVRCKNCNAAVSYDVEVKAPRCAFCDSVTELETREDPPEAPEGYLPFRVDDASARGRLSTWLQGGGFFQPADLGSTATLESLTPLWWVGWTFDAQALVSWTADSDLRAGRADWAPYAGQQELMLEKIVVSASRGLTHDEVRELAPHYELGSAEAKPHPMPGAVHETFDLNRSGARQAVRQALEAVARQEASAWVPGTRQRKLKVIAKVRRLTTRRLVFPAHVLAYRYRDKLYRVIVHGQDPEVIVGKRPVSWLKVTLVVGGVVAALLFAAWLAGR